MACSDALRSSNSGRNRRLDVLVVHLTEIHLQGKQPAQVHQPQVPGGELGADPRHVRELPFRLFILPAVRIPVGQEAEDHVAARLDDRKALV